MLAASRSRSSVDAGALASVDRGSCCASEEIATELRAFSAVRAPSISLCCRPSAEASSGTVAGRPSFDSSSPPRRRNVPADAIEPARDSDRTRPIAQVVLDLSLDHRRRKGGETNAPAGVKPVAGLEEPDGAHLHEIIELLALADVPAGDRFDEWKVRGDQALARHRVRNRSRPRHYLNPLVVKPTRVIPGFSTGSISQSSNAQPLWKRDRIGDCWGDNQQERKVQDTKRASAQIR